MKVFGVGQENGQRGAVSLALPQATVAESGVAEGMCSRENICRERSTEEAMVAMI
jgi:hypothetical protein